MPQMPQTTPSRSPPLPLPLHTPLVDDAAPILQKTVEGIMKNLGLEDAEVGIAGFKDHNIATMLDMALAAESAEQEVL
jgi:hypothetical protein